MTWTVLSPTTDGYIESGQKGSGSYVDALSGVTALNASTTGFSNSVGQYIAKGGYIIDVIFLTFDTSGTSPVVVELALKANSSTGPAISTQFQARSWAWSAGGLTTADWPDGDEVAAAPLLASYPSEGWTANGYMTFTSESGFASAINTSGATDIILVTDRHVAHDAPEGFTETGNFLQSDSSGGWGARLRISDAALPTPPNLYASSAPARWRG